MVKSYSEYIKEHFGAITIEYPPEHMVVRNPNLPQPLAINTWVGGTGRIPMHWNNSPYLSGGFGGSGYGRFGQDPAGENKIDLNQEADDAYDARFKALIELSGVANEFYQKEEIIYKDIVDTMMTSIENSDLDLNDADTGESEFLNLTGITVSSEELEAPTSGTSGTYWDPPDPGEAGEYETCVSGPEMVIPRLGFDNVSKIPTLDDVGNVLIDNANIANLAAVFHKHGDLGKSALVKIIEMANTIYSKLGRVYESYDEEYQYGETARMLDDEELIDAVDVEHYGIFKYVLLLTRVIMDNKGKQKEIRAEVRQTQSALDFMEISKLRNNVAKKTYDLKNVIDRVIDIPFKLKRA